MFWPEAEKTPVKMALRLGLSLNARCLKCWATEAFCESPLLMFEVPLRTPHM